MARTFDGIDDVLTIADMNEGSAGPWSLAVYIFPTSGGVDGNAFLSYGDDGVAATGWMVKRLQAGTIQVRLPAPQFVTSTGTAPLDTWTHVGIRRAGTGVSAVQIVLNGTQDATANRDAVNAQAAGDDFLVGQPWANDATGTARWVGGIARVRYWPGIALTDEEFAQDRDGTTPQAASARLILDIGGTASPEPDTSGQGHDATVTGTTFLDDPLGGPTTHEGAAIIAAVSTVTASAVAGAVGAITVSWTEPVYEFTELVETWIEESADGDTWTLVTGSEKAASDPGGGGSQQHTFTPAVGTTQIRIGALESPTGNISYSDPVAVEGGATIHLAAAQITAASSVTAGAAATYRAAATVAAVSGVTARTGDEVVFSAGVVPIKEAADTSAPGVVKVFVTTAGTGVVPTRTVAEFVAGVVPVKFELAAGVGIVNVSDVDA